MKNQDQIRIGINKEFYEAQAARDTLEDATFRSAALLEALAALLELTEKSDHPKLSESAVEGLQFVAAKEGANLRERLEHYTGLIRRGKAVAA
jgi:hypothetical protein